MALPMYILNGVILVIVLTICGSAPLMEIDPELFGDNFEGDIILDNFRNGIVDRARMWPNATLYYRISSEFSPDEKQNISRAMSTISSVSCIKFKTAPIGNDKYVHIMKDKNECSSEVGFKNMRQFVRLNSYCVMVWNKTSHELLHSLGFDHMQSTPKRDEYVEIREKNIIPNKLFNFEKHVPAVSTDFGIEYDYDSVMHYSPTAFSIDGKLKTIVPLKDLGNIEMGQRNHISKKDILKLNLMYNCTTV